jgi:hypothetical protein
MRIKIVASLISFLISCSVSAQTDSVNHHSLSYFNQFSSGALLGKKNTGSSLTTSMIHGIRYKKISIGFGLGYDSYTDWRSVPVLGAISVDVATFRQNSLYVQFSGGYSKPWHIENDDPFTYHSKNGRTLYPSIGYRIHADRWRLYISAGYKLQRINYQQESRYVIWDYPNANHITVKRDMNRLAIQIAIGFN